MREETISNNYYFYEKTIIKPIQNLCNEVNFVGIQNGYKKYQIKDGLYAYINDSHMRNEYDMIITDEDNIHNNVDNTNAIRIINPKNGYGKIRFYRRGKSSPIASFSSISNDYLSNSAYERDYVYLSGTQIKPIFSKEQNIVESEIEKYKGSGEKDPVIQSFIDFYEDLHSFIQKGTPKQEVKQPSTTNSSPDFEEHRNKYETYYAMYADMIKSFTDQAIKKEPINIKGFKKYELEIDGKTYFYFIKKEKGKSIIHIQDGDENEPGSEDVNRISYLDEGKSTQSIKFAYPDGLSIDVGQTNIIIDRFFESLLPSYFLSGNIQTQFDPVVSAACILDSGGILEVNKNKKFLSFYLNAMKFAIRDREARSVQKALEVVYPNTQQTLYSYYKESIVDPILVLLDNIKRNEKLSGTRNDNVNDENYEASDLKIVRSSEGGNINLSIKGKNNPELKNYQIYYDEEEGTISLYGKEGSLAQFQEKETLEHCQKNLPPENVIRILSLFINAAKLAEKSTMVQRTESSKLEKTGHSGDDGYPDQE